MTGAAPGPLPSTASSWAGIAVGLSLAGFGFLAAAAEGMATAPGAMSGLVPLAIMVVGAALTAVGAASLALPRLRRASKHAAVAVLLGLLFLYVAGQILMLTGLYDA